MNAWTVERLKTKSSAEIQNLYRNACRVDSPEARSLRALIEEHDLYRDADGGLPHDHPIMLEIEDICRSPDAIAEAVAAAENGLPPLAGFEHRLVAALGGDYGTHYTTHHAGRRIAEEMERLGWHKGPQKPMPAGSVAQTATTFTKKGQTA